MPSYNVEDTIDEAIQSVLAQQGVFFELLIADDGSMDRTWIRIQSYRFDPRVRLWRFPRRLGSGEARNWLIKRSCSDYLAICDADDVMLPGHLARLVETADCHPWAGVFYNDLVILDSQGNHQAVHLMKGPTQEWDLLGKHVWHGGTLVRRSCMLKVGGYRPTLPFMVDYDLFLRLADIAPFERVRGKPLFLHRRRRGSLSDKALHVQRRMGRRILRDAILRRYGYRVPW